MGRFRISSWEEVAADHPDLVVTTRPPDHGRVPVSVDSSPARESGDAVLRLPGALVGPVGVHFEDRLLLDSVHYMPDVWRTTNWLPFRLAEGDWAELDEPDATVVDGPLLFVDAVNGRANFGHFVHDSLAYAPLQHVLAAAGHETVAFVPEWSFESQQRLADLCFLGKRDRPWHAWYQCEDLYVAPRQFRMDNPPASRDVLPQRSWEWLAGRIPECSEHRALPPSGPPVYLTRAWGYFGEASAPQGRNFSNGPAVDRVAADLGFTAIDCSSTPVLDVIRAVAVAPAVVGVHGAQLAHILWANDAAKVVELEGPGGCWRSTRALAAGRSLARTSVRASLEGDRVVLDLDALKTALTEALS